MHAGATRRPRRKVGQQARVKMVLMVFEKCVGVYPCRVQADQNKTQRPGKNKKRRESKTLRLANNNTPINTREGVSSSTKGEIDRSIERERERERETERDRETDQF